MLRDKVIGNSLHVHDILRNISKTQELEATVIFSANDIHRGGLYYYRKDKQLFFKLFEMDERFIPRSKIHVSFILKETVFSFDTEIIEITENVLELTLPSVFTSSFKRHFSRYTPTDSETLLVKMQDGSLHDVKDITTSGVAFYSEKLDYKIGDRIRNMQILLTDDFVCLDADVRYIIEADNGNFFYGTAFIDNNWFNHYSLFRYIFKNTYPDIRQITDFNKETIFLLYENSNYFKLKPWDEIKESFNNMFLVLNQIKEYPQVISNPVFVHNEKLYMGASALRIYNRTFLAQHLASIPEARLFPSSKQSIYLGISDYLICNPYYSYYITYFDAKSKWHNRMYGSIAGYINDDAKYLNDTLDYFELYTSEYSQMPNNPYKANIMDDPTEFCDYVELNMLPILRKAYEYEHENINLDEIKQVYDLIGLYLARKIIKLTHEGRTIAYAVCEAYTPGLNLYNVLDLMHILIVDKTVDMNAVMDALISESLYFYERYEKSKFNIFVQFDQGVKDTINIPGLKYDFLVGRGIVDRSGIVEYKNLILNMTR